MGVLGWSIVIIPVIFVIWISFHSSKFVRSVADYLAVGRVAGRYVLAVGDLQMMLGLITLVAMVEEQYQCGLALTYWGALGAPLAMFMSLTGFCTYRYRETKSLSVGQFFEMRYSRNFRIVAAVLRTISEMMANAIGPAVAARFFIYFLGFPHVIKLGGVDIPTFSLVVTVVLALAMLIIWTGGRVALLVSDCLQGLISYPIFVIITVYILTRLSFINDIGPILADRVAGQSYINPFDVNELRDFNLFALAVSMIGMFFSRAGWIGGDASMAAKTPHEQKMAGIFGSWRNGFSWMMCMFLGVVLIAVMSHGKFAPLAHEVRTELSDRVLGEVVDDSKLRGEIVQKIAALPVAKHETGVDQPFSRDNNMDTPYLQTVKRELEHTDNGNLVFQKFRTLYFQMMMPVALKEMFPEFLMGLFCLLALMLMLTTDDSRIFNSTAIIVQDIIMPFRKKPFSEKEHFLYLRFCALSVAIFFGVVSIFLSQLDYINMFLTIITAVWLGGGGAVVFFGLYSRFGTTWGAYAALVFGSGSSVAGILIQRNWADYVYPAISALGWVELSDKVLRTISSPFNPYIVWVMDPVKCPINSREMYFMSIMAGIFSYVAVSLLTYKEPFNLDRMLHRGIYRVDDGSQIQGKSLWSWSNFYEKIITITPEYSKMDKCIAYLVFLHSFGYSFLLCFCGSLVWNFFSPLPQQYWIWYFFINLVVVAGIIGVISTVWFFIGGWIDMRKLFRDLKARMSDPLDDGWVEGHVSRSDQKLVDQVEKSKH